MSRTRSFASLRRALIRRLDNQADDVLLDLRDDIWDRIITRQFMTGSSIEHVAESQPERNTRWKVEAAIRRHANKRAQKVRW